MYIVIVGAGNIGRPLLDIATSDGNEVVVVERDHEKAAAASNAFDCLVINDDATSKDTLLDAGTDEADALISTTDQDATNVMVCLLAQELEVPHIVSVVHNPEHMALFERIGVNAMENPQRLIADHLYRAIKRPAIGDFMHVGETAAVFEIVVTEDAPVAGKTLSEVGDDGIISEEVLVIAVARDGVEEPITPRGDTRIKPNDRLTVYSGVGASPEVTDVFGHYEDN